MPVVLVNGQYTDSDSMFFPRGFTEDEDIQPLAGIFKSGEYVADWSKTHILWMDAHISHINYDENSFDLDIKHNARPSKVVKRAHAVTGQSQFSTPVLKSRVPADTASSHTTKAGSAHVERGAHLWNKRKSISVHAKPDMSVRSASPVSAAPVLDWKDIDLTPTPMCCTQARTFPAGVAFTGPAKQAPGTSHDVEWQSHDIERQACSVGALSSGVSCQVTQAPCCNMPVHKGSHGSQKSLALSNNVCPTTQCLPPNAGPPTSPCLTAAPPPAFPEQKSSRITTPGHISLDCDSDGKSGRGIDAVKVQSLSSRKVVNSPANVHAQLPPPIIMSEKQTLPNRKNLDTQILPTSRNVVVEKPGTSVNYSTMVDGLTHMKKMDTASSIELRPPPRSAISLIQKDTSPQNRHDYTRLIQFEVPSPPHLGARSSTRVEASPLRRSNTQASPSHRSNTQLEMHGQVPVSPSLMNRPMNPQAEASAPSWVNDRKGVPPLEIPAAPHNGNTVLPQPLPIRKVDDANAQTQTLARSSSASGKLMRKKELDKALSDRAASFQERAGLSPVLTSSGPVLGAAVPPRQNRCIGPMLEMDELIIGSGPFDPSEPSVHAQLVSKLGRHKNSTFKQLQGFRGGLNEGIWILNEPVAESKDMVLKLVKCKRIAPTVLTEAENFSRIHREYPSIRDEPYIAFPQKMFSCVVAGGVKRYDLIVMWKVAGRRLTETLALKWHEKEVEEVMKIIEKLGSVLGKFHLQFDNCQHGDLTPSNVLYDAESDNLAFIDMGGMGLPTVKSDVEHFSASLRLLSDVYGEPFLSEGTRAFERGYAKSMTAKRYNGHKSAALVH